MTTMRANLISLLCFAIWFSLWGFIPHAVTLRSIFLIAQIVFAVWALFLSQMNQHRK
jgi:hypothetical protein